MTAYVGPSVPQTLIDIPQWTARDADKVPLNPRTGRYASATDPATWGTYDEALAACKTFPAAVGVSIVLTRELGIVGLDLDGVVRVSHDISTVTDKAKIIVAAVSTYWEFSPSGTGLRAFAFSSLPEHGRKRGDFEVYNDGRALSVTGRDINGTPTTVEDRETEIRALHRQVFGDPQPVRPLTPRVGASRLSDAEVWNEHATHATARSSSGCSLATWASTRRVAKRTWRS